MLHTEGLSHQRSFQVEGLSVLKKEHDVSLQVAQTPVSMTSNSLLKVSTSLCVQRVFLLNYTSVLCVLPDAERKDLLWPHLDLSEVYRLADQFIVLWQLFPRRQLDEHLTQLTPTGAAGNVIIRMGQKSKGLAGSIYPHFYFIKPRMEADSSSKSYLGTKAFSPCLQ